MSGIDVDHLQERDLKEIIRVFESSRDAASFERPPTVDELRAFTLGNSEFRSDGSWIVRSEGVVAAYAFVMIESGRLSAGLDDAYLDFNIMPDERGKGIEPRVLNLASDYVRARGIGKMRTRCDSSESWRRDLLVSEGFGESYHVFVLVRDGRDQVGETPLPSEVKLVRRPTKECGDEEMQRIVEALNDAFSDHYNSAPEPVEKFIKYRDVCRDPEVFSLAFVGDEIVGVCLSSEDMIANEQKGTRRGWIAMLGVRKPHRGRGVGRALLADGMSWVLERGMDSICIPVQAMNERALGLYRDAGFEIRSESMWFEKAL